MKNKIFLAGLMLLFSLSLSAKTYSGTCGDNLTWTLEDGTLTISGTGAMTNYEYDNNASPWYSNRSSITSVTIADGVTSIGNNAFFYCSGLTSVTIPNSVTSIGNHAFFDCSGLTSVTIPNSVTSIGEAAFYECIRLASLTIGNSVTYIGDIAFEHCTGLRSIEIPNSVTSIGKAAFYGCNNVFSIAIPNSVISIGESAFENIPNISYFGSVDGSPWGAISLNGYVEDYFVYSDNTKTTLLACDRNHSYNIPNSVTSIGSLAFSYNNLSYIEIPNSVTSIGEGAFYGCKDLNFIVIPNGVTSIEALTFAHCSSFVDILIPNSVTSIGVAAFYFTPLSSITIPNSVTSIGESAFDGCMNLPVIDDIRYADTYLVETANRNLSTYTIKEGTRWIGSGAFYNCSSLTSIDIPNSVTSIGNGAFDGCFNLTSVTIPENVTSIGKEGFRGCRSLTEITCEAVIPPALGHYIFSAVDKSIPLYVPAGSVEAYKVADGWKDFFNILPIGGQEECKYETTDGATVWEDELPYTWESVTFSEAGTETLTLQASDGCDSVVTFTLRVRYHNIVLQENEDAQYYDFFAEDYNGYTVNTATLNRQFTQSKWATLCLPFDVRKGQMMSLGLYGRVFEFRYAETPESNTLVAHFAVAQSVEAGKGYIVNANAKLAQKTSFVFPGVTVNTDADNGDITTLTGYNDNSGRGSICMVGTLRTGTLYNNAGGNTYLGLKDNMIYCPNTTTGTAVRAYRGFFRSGIGGVIEEGDDDDEPAVPQRIRIIVEGETVTELDVMNGEADMQDIQPARKFIDNGILYIERNGKTYTAQGAELR